MRKTKGIRIISFILSLCIFTSMGVWADTDSDIAEMEAARDALDSQISDYESKLGQLSSDEADAQEYKETLDLKISALEDRIDTAREDIKTLNASIKELEEKLRLSEERYKETIETLKVRLKALYKAGDVGTLEILLNSSSLYEFSLRSETLKSVASHDKYVMDEIQKYVDETQADRDKLSKRKTEVAAMKKQYESDQDELEVTVGEQEELINSLQSQQVSTQGRLAEAQEESAEYNNQISNLIAQKKKEEEERKRQEEEERKRQEEEAAKNPGSGGTNVDTGGSTGGDGSGMSEGFDPRWPLPGYDTSWITCWYGEGGHNGLDIAGAYGAEIVAAQSGEVISAEYHDSWGNNVLIYHNGTYSTRYAHMSSMAVSPGQYVERGQVIGYVGSTGYSFGNHLHFEVYVDGYRVDPYGYL